MSFTSFHTTTYEPFFSGYMLMRRGAGSGLAAAVMFAAMEPLVSVDTLISYLAPRGIPENECTKVEFVFESIRTLEV